jgi:tetratricopeptide (TPR) repeat protein
MARKLTPKGQKPTQRELAALERAQDLIYDAWDAGTTKKAVALVTRALEISPLCADAHVFLAQIAEPGSEEELELWKSGVEAGEKALGAEAFEKMLGEFWGWIETRPYMRARAGLASALWKRGRRREAICHLQDMLRLNPNDNQGVRYILLGYLAATDDHEGIAKLGETYDEYMAMWLWPLALAAFRREGDTEQSRQALHAAIGSNSHVPRYLLGEKKLPKCRPDYYGIGDDREAVLYVSEFGESWGATPGAMEWLRASAPATPRKKPRAGIRSRTKG